MTKHEALTSIAQTLLRLRGHTAEIDALPGPVNTETLPIHLRIAILGNISRTVGDCAKLVGADENDECNAVWELGRRYAVWA